MNLTLKNFKHYPSMSEETECFQASLYLDGTKIGSCENRGTGGQTEVNVTAEMMAALSQYAATLPGASEFELVPGMVDDMVADFLIVKDARQLMKSRVISLRNGVLMQSKKCPDGQLEAWKLDAEKRGYKVLTEAELVERMLSEAHAERAKVNEQLKAALALRPPRK